LTLKSVGKPIIDLSNGAALALAREAPTLTRDRAGRTLNRLQGQQAWGYWANVVGRTLMSSATLLPVHRAGDQQQRGRHELRPSIRQDRLGGPDRREFKLDFINPVTASASACAMRKARRVSAAVGNSRAQLCSALATTLRSDL